MRKTIAGSQRPLGYEVTLVPSFFRMGGRAPLFASSRDISLENFVMSLLGHAYLRSDTHQTLFGSANSFESYCVHTHDPRTYIQPDRQTDGNFFCLFSVLRYTKHEHSSKVEFVFQSCDYNTFSFYILHMWWESENFLMSVWLYVRMYVRRFWLWTQ